jgi:putative salt-induced outer membrane protein YdiY
MPSKNPHLTTGALACMLLLVSVAVAAAQSPPEPGKALPDISWVPPEDSFDWVQLKSGEWLKGELKALQDRELEFDSEEMDYQTFDWEKIRQLRTYKQVQVLLVNGEILSGRVMITPDEVRLLDGTNRQWPRTQIQSVTPAGSRERSFWSGDVTVGLTRRGGNVEETDFNGDLHLQRRTPATRLTLNYNANYSQARNVVNDDNWRASVRFDKWISNRFYLVIPTAEYYSDPLQNIGDRTTVGAGVAYELFNTPRLEWNVYGVPGYQWLRYTSTQPGEPLRREGVAMGLGSRLEWDITKDIDLTLEYQGQFASKSAGDSTHHASSRLSVDLTRRLEIDLSFIWDRTVSPPQTADGTRPESDDYRLVFGLSFEF